MSNNFWFFDIPDNALEKQKWHLAHPYVMVKLKFGVHWSIFNSALGGFCICTLKVLSFSVVSSHYLQWFLIPFLFNFCISPLYMDTAYNTKQSMHQPNDQYWMYTIYDFKKSTSLEWYSLFNICTHCTFQIIRSSPHFIICVWVGSLCLTDTSRKLIWKMVHFQMNWQINWSLWDH